MDHARFKANHTAALYVRGDLEERSQETFEMHLMSCASCVEDVEVWRALRTGMREEGADPRPVPSIARSARPAVWQTGAWPLAASLAVIAIGSGAGGWYARSLSVSSLADNGIAVFTLPPLTRGYEDCEPLPVDGATDVVALRIPNAVTGWQLELTDEEGAPLPATGYSVRTQADGSWLLRMRAKPLQGEVLRLQSRASDGVTEPLGCIVIPSG
jgi:hypothetical protein